MNYSSSEAKAGTVLEISPPVNHTPQLASSALRQRSNVPLCLYEGRSGIYRFSILRNAVPRGNNSAANNGPLPFLPQPCIAAGPKGDPRL